MNSHDPFIRGLPKAKLHMHIEGSISPWTRSWGLARNGFTAAFMSEEKRKDALASVDAYVTKFKSQPS